MILTLILFIPQIVSGFQGCKCSQLEIQSDCENAELPCKWVNNKCEMKSCSERRLDNCLILKLFSNVDETAQCLPITYLSKCLSVEELVAYPCSQMSFPSTIDETQYSSYCMGWFCNYDASKKKCIDYTSTCPDYQLADCITQKTGTNRKVNGQCTWIDSKCAKENISYPYRCSDFLTPQSCSATIQCIWGNNSCRNLVCSDLSLSGEQSCLALVDLSDTYGTRVCYMESQNKCSIKDPGDLPQDKCQSRTYNAYYWDYSSKKCVSCVIILYYEIIRTLQINISLIRLRMTLSLFY